jgi:Polyketide cyclase / dehydrase and lipid transport
MPDVTRSVVRARQPGRAIVEQEAVSRVALFVKRVRLVLDIVEEDQVLRFTDICSSRRYEGAWRFLPRDNGTAITYELTARPSFEVPDFLLKRVLKRNAVRMIDQLRNAIAARAARQQ